MIIFVTVREAEASVGHVVFLIAFDDCLNIIQGTDAKRYHGYSSNNLQQDTEHHYLWTLKQKATLIMNNCEYSSFP